MIGYIYRITITNEESSIFGKNYIGLHLAKEFDRHYFGSGRVIKDYRKKYGNKGLYKEILDTSDSVDELMDLEVYYISSELGLYNNINIQKGGRLGNTGISFRKGFKMKQESIDKMKETKRNNPRMFTKEEKLKASKRMSGKGNHMYGADVKDIMTPEKYKDMLEKRSTSMTGKLRAERNPMFNNTVKNDDIIYLYNKNYSIKNISIELNCTYNLVYRRLASLGLNTKKKQIDKDKVKNLYLNGKSRKEISTLLGCTPDRIGQIIKELKI